MSHRFKTPPAGVRLAGVFILIVCFVFTAATAGSWKGEEVVKDGVVHVKNPATPVETPSTSKLEERWRVGGDDESSDVIFGVLIDITTDDDGNVYLLDTQLNEIMIYSPDGEYLRSIGREGEGPGEFRRPRNIFMTPDGHVAVLQSMPGKIILLTKDGEAAGNHPVPESDGVMMFSGAFLAGDNIVVATQQFVRREASFIVNTTLIRIDPEGKQTAKYWDQSKPEDMNNLVFDERKLGHAPIWSAAPDGRVLLCEDFDAYRIHVFNPDGTLERVIERDFELRKRTEEEKDWRGPRIRIATGQGERRTQMIKSETDRTVLAIYPQHDGSIWVLSSTGAFDTGDDEIATFDVFDTEGKFTRQVKLLGEGNYDYDGFLFAKNSFFVMKSQRSAQISAGGAGSPEDEDQEEPEPMSVICYELGDIVQSMR